MSTDYWLNRVGTAATVTTPSGSIPQYGLAADIGTAAWPDTQQYQAWVRDGVAATRGQDIARMQAAKDEADRGWWQKLEDSMMEGFTSMVGSDHDWLRAIPVAGPWLNEAADNLLGEDVGTDEQRLQRGSERLGKAADTPVIKQLGQIWNFSSNVIETPFIMDRNAGLRGTMSNWFDSSEWSAAWREAEERTIGEAFLDSVLTGIGLADSERDLDRMRRTNSLYGMTSFAADLYVGFKFDPTVGAMKTLGEAKRIRIGAMPRGQTSRAAAAAARRAVIDPDYRYTGSNPMGKYGEWRGKRILRSFEDVRKAALELSYADLMDLPMFRSRAVNGPQAALAMQIAAKDDRLWDLTRRSVMGDPRAWAEINQLKLDPLALQEFAPDARTFIDAVEGTKTKMSQLQSEIEDLEKVIAKREELGPPTSKLTGEKLNPGFFEHHTWELHRDLDGKLADLNKADTTLAGYEDYATWLEKVKDEGVFAQLDQVATGNVPERYNLLKSRTYQKSLFGQTHTVSEISKAGWIKSANPIDLHRVDSGVMSIRRQFIQYKHLFGYEDYAAYSSAIERFARAKDALERYKIAKEIEDTHLPRAIAHKHGLDPVTVDAFLNETRLRRNEMANALLSGQGAVYTTAPNALDSAKLVKLDKGIAEIELMDNGRRVTMRIPEEALHVGKDLPVDVTQTPNYYTPMDTRQVHLAIKRNPELFELLDSDIRNGMREAAGKTMETIDKYGTAFNSLWKPLQLFRLAWPQRVLMDEGLRAMAVLGISDWSRTFFPALAAASVNAINPALHNMGLGKMLDRRRMKIGPGPLADEIAGRKYDVPTHEAAVEAAPFVPAYLAPRYNPRRGTATLDFLNEAIPLARRRQRAAALLRDPNPTRSLDPLVYERGAPENWQDIDSALGNAERQPLMGEWNATTGDDLAIARREPEDFDSGDFAYAAAGLRMSEEDVIAELSGVATSAQNKLDRFLMAPPELQVALWNDWTITPWSDLGDALRAIEDIAEDFKPGGSMRQVVRDAVKAGKKEFVQEVAKRKTGAGHRPLFTGVFDDLDSPFSRLEMMLAKELGAKWVPISGRLAFSSFDTRPRHLAVRPRDLTAHAESHPIYTKIANTLGDAYGRRPGRPGANQAGPSGKIATVRMFDPTNGRTTRQGFAVRVASTTIDEGVGNPHRLTQTASIDAIDQLIVQNQQFLSSSGYRLLVEAGGDGKARVSVVRYFRTNEKAQAIEFARHTNADSFYRLGGLKNQTRPAGAKSKTQVGNLVDEATPGYELYIRDWNDQSPIMEELNRQFGQYVEQGDELSTTPAPLVDPPEGPKPVFHGSNRDLPEQLLPRVEAPIDMGRVYGPGFYTAVDPNTAGSYGSQLYTIKSTRDGKKYNILSMDDAVRDADRAELLDAFERWANRVQDAGVEYFGYDRWERMIGGVRRDLESAYQWDGIINQVSNGDLGAYFGGPSALRADEFLAEWFLNAKNVGALRTQWGGHDLGAVYVWLDPENLVIKPAYGGDDKWYLLEEWFSNPNSQERLLNRVPESRIIRTGKRKEFRELEEIHRLRMLREQEVNKARQSDPNHPMVWDDPKYNALLGREQAMMRRLGVEYTHNIAGLNRRRGTNVPENEGSWWTQVHPERAMAAARQRELGPAAAGDLRRAEVHELDAVADAFDGLFNATIDNTHQRFVRRLLKRREYGKGHTKWRTADGRETVVQNFLEGEGEVYVPLISAAPAYARLTDTYKRTLSRYREKAVGFKRINPPDVSPARLRTRQGYREAVEYYTSWADLLNDQVRNSPIWFKMLEGQSDEAILNWLTRSDEGARIRRSLPHKGRYPERWVEEHRQALDFYLPDKDLQRLMAQQRIKPSDLRRIDQRNLPEIFGPELEMVAGEKGWGKEIAALSEKIYHALGTVPTDLLSRQPFAKAMYDLKMRNLIAASDADWLTPEILKDMEKTSREFAVRELRKTMFDLTDETNMTQALRFIAPFWGAQSEAIMKWMRIAVERPETVARFFVGMNSVYNNITVIDEDGKAVDGFPGVYNPNHRMILQIPPRLKKLPFFDKALNEIGTVGIAFSSANTALQGDMPLLPSLGPIVTVPADKMVNAMWDTHGTQFDDNFFYRWLFPVGRTSGGFTGVLEQIFPGWGRRMLAMQQGQDSTMYANTWFMVQREMTLDARKNGQPDPSAEEVERAVKWHFALRVIGAFAFPAAMEYRPKNQFFLDQYHEMQRQYGPGKAFEKFIEKFGADAARYAASGSHGLVPPTSKGMEEWSQNQDLVQKVTEMGYPELALAIYSPDAWADDYSSDSLREQYEINVGPGSSTKLRELQDPLERAMESDRRVGWVQYRQFMSALQAELYNRGLTSFEQRGAEDLNATKKAFTQELESSNMAWSRDFRTYSDDVYNQVEVLRGFALDRRFDNRPDMQGVRQYLLIRDAAAQSLDAWAAQGGSRSLQAQENTALRNWFYDQVGQLIQANPAFGEFYSRFLDADRLERGSGP